MSPHRCVDSPGYFALACVNDVKLFSSIHLQVNSYRDRIVLFILSQICFQQHDLTDAENMVFLCPGHHEKASIIWHEGEAAGYYTLKPKGNLLLHCILIC